MINIFQQGRLLSAVRYLIDSRRFIDSETKILVDKDILKELHRIMVLNDQMQCCQFRESSKCTSLELIEPSVCAGGEDNDLRGSTVGLGQA